VRSDEASRFKDLRLAALADSPDAFWTTHAEALAYRDEEWTDVVQRAQKDEQAIFVAIDDDRWVGMAGLFPDRNVPDALHLWGMWVDPTHRAQGVGAALLAAVLDTAAEVGAPSIYLEVVENNLGARRLYERTGFVPTGITGPIRELTEIEMVMELAR
jgi:GNAT superfamily N-acetyltransferase